MFLMNAPDKFAQLLSLRRDLHLSNGEIATLYGTSGPYTDPGATLYIPPAAEAKQAA
jgi:hypothetical protein